MKYQRVIREEIFKKLKIKLQQSKEQSKKQQSTEGSF